MVKVFSAACCTLLLCSVASAQVHYGESQQQQNHEWYSDPSVEQLIRLQELVQATPFVRELANTMIAAMGYVIPSELPPQLKGGRNLSLREGGDEDEGMLPKPIDVEELLKRIDEFEQKYPGLKDQSWNLDQKHVKEQLKEALRNILKHEGMSLKYLDEAVNQILGNGGVWIPFLEWIDPELALQIDIFNQSIKIFHLVLSILKDAMQELESSGTNPTLRALVETLVARIEGGDCPTNHPGDGMITEDELECFAQTDSRARQIKKRIEKIIEDMKKLQSSGSTTTG